jgi:hypothetical protein
MNMIHKRTLTDTEREENERRLDELQEQIWELDSENEKDRKQIERLKKERSDLGDSGASSDLADSVEDGQLRKKYRNRSISQLRIEYDRNKTNKADKAESLCAALKQLNRREEATAWFVRALRFGRFAYANGDKQLLRDMLDINHFDGDDPEESLDSRFGMRCLEYLARRTKKSLDELEETVRQWKTEIPDILVCGPSSSDCDDLIEWVLQPDDESGDFDEMEEDDSPDTLIRKTAFCPFAKFIETKTIFGSDPELKVPRGKTMREFVRDVERERHGGEIEDESELSWADRIDAVWYVTDGDRDSIDRREREFIRSIMELPNAMLVVNLSCSVVSREDLIEAVDALTDIVDPSRIVLVASGYYGLSIDARWRLIEFTKEKYKENEVFASDEERRNFDSAWTDYFGELLEKWRGKSARNAERCILHAAGRARFIAEREDGDFSDWLNERIVRAFRWMVPITGLWIPDDRIEDASCATELLKNIAIMIYELGGCCGHVAVKSDAAAILSCCDIRCLPNDAAAVAYAVGMTAKAFFEREGSLSTDELKDVFAKAKEEGLQLSFEPMSEDDPDTSFLFDDDDDDEFEDDDDIDGGDDDGDDDDGLDDDDDIDGGDDDGDDDGKHDFRHADKKTSDDFLLFNKPCVSFLSGVSRSESENDSILSEDDGDVGHDGKEDDIDYGDGTIVSSSGGPPDSPDNASGRRFRLPADHPAPGDVLGTDLISGGWGYAMRDATVVRGSVIPNEKVFIQDRVEQELRRMEEISGEKYVFSGYQKYAHELVQDGNDFYDLLFVQIEIIPEADWNQLKADWESHAGYENDKKGRRRHEKWQDGKTIRFTERFWFNVNDMFSFDGNEESDAPENES